MALQFPLSEGEAHAIGDGVFVLFQDDPNTSKVQSLVLTADDLRTMLSNTKQLNGYHGDAA